MLRLALDSAAGWEVCDLELRRSGPSYTIDTLAALHREGLSALQIFFIIGTDAFAEIATWHRSGDVLDAAHMAVVARPGYSLEALRGRVPTLASRMIDADALEAATTTRIVLVPAATPDVSSTDIRRRARRDESLRGLVPPAVATYIETHGLYRGTAASASVAAGNDSSGS